TGIGPIDSFDTSGYPSRLGAATRDFNPKDFMPPLKYRRMSRVSRLAVAASIEALKDAGLRISPERAPAVGVMIGTGYGSTSQTDEFFVGMLKEGPGGANPSLFPDTVPNAAASQVSIYHGLKGPNTTFSHNEVSGEQALACACQFLREDRAEAILVGSVDELSSVLFHSLAALRALSPQGKGPEGMRPFDRTRNGRVLGEGAGILVLEKKKPARERGAKIYGSVIACASTGGPVGTQRYEAGAEQMARAMKLAFQKGGVTPEQIDYISAAANSTRELDRAEAEAVQRAFGGKSRSVPISSLKGHIGDFCGSFGLRAAGLLLAMGDEKIPPTLGLADPEFPLDHILHLPRSQRIQLALYNGFSFGGANVCFLFKNERHGEAQ
ncbi:MAG: beta-ketoacyl-[acyl-carrier-protein] synthase family protein, partial [Deltaproteobacteria bacterium]|nr:beta-ketoacyl-[acyl-carrier-protein] synthase family protein [Deltaproteobacteria bacterium]